MDWGKIQDALINFFSKSAKIPFVWDNEPRACLQKPYGVLALGQSVIVGRDYSSYSFENSDLTLNLYGQREITINVQIYARQVFGEHSSRSIIENTRLSLATLNHFRGEMCSHIIYVDSHPIIDLNFSFDQRNESRSSFDVVFRVPMQESFKDIHTGYFKSIEIKEDLHAR